MNEELRQQITEALARADGHRWIHITDARRTVLTEAYAAKVAAILPHIQAAEERGRREALEAFICGACGHRVGWIDCPTGGWWAHEVHPADDHDATECVPESESP